MEHIYLSHHGIKGQKWGVRRFQLKNGKLTMAGKKRYSEDAEDEKKKEEEDSEPKKRSVKDMSDQELRDAINRAQLEESYKKYYEAPVQQKTVSAGEKFAKEMLKKVVLDPAMDAAAKGMRSSLEKMVNDKVNKKTEDSIRDLIKRDLRDLNEPQLKRVVEYKDLEKRLNEHNDRDSVMDRESKRIDYEQKKLSYEKNLMSRDIMSKQLEKATAEAAKAVKDLEMTSYVKDKEESVRRGQDAVMQMFNSPLALPAPKDDLKHSDVIEHHGIKGQRWGVRRFQNDDGSLTPMGKRRYNDYFDDDGSLTRQGQNNIRSVDGVTDDNLIVGYMGRGVSYVSDYVKEYGDIPINRIRFDAGASTSTYGNRADGMSFDFDWHDTKMSDVMDAYDEYKKSLNWD